MADAITGETNKDRAKLAREAGIGKLSLLAVLAGAVTAFGTFAILLAIISAMRAVYCASKICVNTPRLTNISTALIREMVSRCMPNPACARRAKTLEGAYRMSM